MHPSVRPQPGRGPRDAGAAWALAALAALLLVTALWWAFALWPVEAGAAPMLERARAVCFGTDSPTGLPDAVGWGLLVGQPLLMGAFLLVVWGPAVRRGVRALAAGGRGRALLLGGATFVLVGLSLAGWRVASAQPARGADDVLAGAQGLAGSVESAAVRPRLDRAAPPLELTDQRGEAFTLDAAAGRPVLVTFAYGHCATICPLVVRNALEAASASDRAPAVVVVTLDPWRDVPWRLGRIASSWGLEGADRWLLGGSAEVVEGALDAWEVPRSRDRRTGEVTHPPLTYVLDAAGVIAFVSRGSTDELLALLGRL